MTSVTDELRRLLDERGVDYRVSATGYSIDIGPYTTAYANRSDTTLDVSLRQVTPEQAIAATLGRGTCRDVRSTDHTIAFECSECGCWVAYDEYWETGIYVLHETGQEHIHPHYCPNCGARVIGEDA